MSVDTGVAVELELRAVRFTRISREKCPCGVHGRFFSSRRTTTLFVVFASLACAADAAPDADQTEGAASSTDGAESTQSGPPNASGTTLATTTTDTEPTSTSTTTSGEPAGTSSETDTTSETETDSETGEPMPEGTFPAVIAQGHLGRTMVSCDDGRTWVADRSLDDSVRCFEPLDCDHNEGGATGLTYGDGIFVATWGWGTDGTIQTSDDGVEWTVVLTGPTFAGTAWGNTTFLAGSKYPYRADASATEWMELADSTLDEWTPRGIGFSPAGGGRFILGGGGDSGDVVVSSDQGDSWEHPEGADACGGSIARIASGGDTIIIATNEGASVDACVSSDGGNSFVGLDLQERFVGGPFWTGSEFVGISSTGRLTSDGEDGTQWTSTPFSTDQPSLTAVARSPNGTFLAQRDGWLVWYEQQAIYRSEDGLAWNELPPTSFTGGHPLRRFTFGYVQPHPDACGR